MVSKCIFVAKVESIERKNNSKIAHLKLVELITIPKMDYSLQISNHMKGYCHIQKRILKKEGRKFMMSLESQLNCRQMKSLPIVVNAQIVEIA